jgi:maltodextrin utilization protein YvdJ
MQQRAYILLFVWNVEGLLVCILSLVLKGLADYFAVAAHRGACLPFT